MRKYKVLYGGGSWDAKDGETVELELEPADENQLVAEGRLEIEPQLYEVTGSSTVFEHKMGERAELALPLEQETALLEGGHISLVKSRKKKADGDGAGADTSKGANT